MGVEEFVDTQLKRQRTGKKTYKTIQPLPTFQPNADSLQYPFHQIERYFLCELKNN